MKQGVRILALNDSPFTPPDRKTRVIGIIGRSGVVEGVLSFSVSVDGTDSTAQIIRSIRRSRFASQIKVLALNGTVVAGLNVIDIARIKRLLKVEPIAVTRKRPHPRLLESVARKRSGREKAELVRKLGRGIEIRKIARFYVQTLPKAEKPSREMTESCVSLLRLAHLVASGVAKGESTGRL